MAGFRASDVAARTHWLPNIFLTGAKRRILPLRHLPQEEA
jgi:hypothetical protein